MPQDGKISRPPVGPRFSLRAVVIVVTLVALLLGLGPWLYEWNLWRQRRNSLEAWAADLDGDVAVSRRTGFWVGGRLYTATNYSLEYSSTWKQIVDGEITSRPGRFYIDPPGEWVDSVDTGIALWRKASNTNQ